MATRIRSRTRAIVRIKVRRWRKVWARDGVSVAILLTLDYGWTKVTAGTRFDSSGDTGDSASIFSKSRAVIECYLPGR